MYTSKTKNLTKIMGVWNLARPTSLNRNVFIARSVISRQIEKTKEKYLENKSLVSNFSIEILLIYNFNPKILNLDTPPSG